jgi:hypothetical protein
MLMVAASICRLLPASELGKCVISGDRDLFRGTADELAEALAGQRIGYHSGRIGGSWPLIIQTT